ncbi:MAG: hypothetical protein IPM81_01920 [Saprospirales bacterium]|nr:hypothetical protein [Saprospirales bacterium]
MAGALVTVRQTAATQPTLADGKVTFNNVPVGEIEYFIMKEGYQFETSRVNVSTDEKTNIFRIPVSKIDDKKILVTGEVTDGEGRDVKDALVEVKIADQISTVKTDASGNYAVSIIPNPEFRSSQVKIEVKKGECKKTEIVDLPLGNVINKDFRLDCNSQQPANDGGRSKETSQTDPVGEFGHVCFRNNLPKIQQDGHHKIEFKLFKYTDGVYKSYATILPQEEKCFYNLQPGVYSYSGDYAAIVSVPSGKMTSFQNYQDKYLLKRAKQ